MRRRGGSRSGARGATAVACALVAGIAERPAHAQGRFPEADAIIFSPANPNVVMAETTFGLLPSVDNGKTWDFLCLEALGLANAGSPVGPSIAFTGSGAFVAGSIDPLSPGPVVSQDLGCNWTCVGSPFANGAAVEVVVRPNLPHRVLALMSEGIAEAGIFSQVYQSADDGSTWAALGPPLGPSIVGRSVDVASGDPNRVYVSASRLGSGPKTASLFVLTGNDAGNPQWIEHPVSAFNPPIPCEEGGSCPSEDELFIAGVDPEDDDVVYLRSSGPTNTATPGNSCFYVTTDGGDSFQEPRCFALSTSASDFVVGITGEALAFAQSPDASIVFVGTREAGLWAALRSDLTAAPPPPNAFRNVNPNVHVQCLASRQAGGHPELWACSDETSGFVVGRSTDNGTTFEAAMPTLTSLGGPLACSPSDAASAAECPATGAAAACTCAAYQQLCSTTEPCNACLGCGQTGSCDGSVVPLAPRTGDSGGTPAPSASATNGAPAFDGGGGAGAPPTGREHSSPNCGCAVVHSPRSARAVLLSGALSVLAVRRRRRR